MPGGRKRGLGGRGRRRRLVVANVFVEAENRDGTCGL